MIGVIADVHGNFAALAEVLKELDKMSVSEVICLGDVAGYYCQINECCNALRDRDIFTIMGNHDWYLSSGEDCPRSNAANKCLDFQRSVISKENLEWLKGLPLTTTVYGISIVHGGWNDYLDEYLKPSGEYFSEINGRFFASGHTHVQRVWQGAGKAYCNPGSVGQPRDGNPLAAFATFDGNSFFLHRVSYDISNVQKDMKKCGFSEYFYENLAKGTRIGGGVSR